MIALVSCSNEDIKCLDNKEVIVETITPSAVICITPEEVITIVEKWDTTQTIIHSECDAEDYLQDLEASWTQLINEHELNSNLSQYDSLYYEFFSNNPPKFSISDNGN